MSQINWKPIEPTVMDSHILCCHSYRFDDKIGLLYCVAIPIGWRGLWWWWWLLMNPSCLGPTSRMPPSASGSLAPEICELVEANEFVSVRVDLVHHLLHVFWSKSLHAWHWQAPWQRSYRRRWLRTCWTPSSVEGRLIMEREMGRISNFCLKLIMEGCIKLGIVTCVYPKMIGEDLKV